MMTLWIISLLLLPAEASPWLKLNSNEKLINPKLCKTLKHCLNNKRSLMSFLCSYNSVSKYGLLVMQICSILEAGNLVIKKSLKNEVS